MTERLPRAPLRVVLDTNTLISALVFGGSFRPLVDAIQTGHLVPHVSRPMLDELAAVLSRDKFRSILHRRDLLPADLVRAYADCTVLILPKALPDIVISEDPSDDKFLACALTAHVDFIVSGDHHLTDLISFHAIPIITPAQLLKEVESDASQEPIQGEEK